MAASHFGFLAPQNALPPFPMLSKSRDAVIAEAVAHLACAIRIGLVFARPAAQRRGSVIVVLT
jgi:hypothetical protein